MKPVMKLKSYDIKFNDEEKKKKNTGKYFRRVQTSLHGMHFQADFILQCCHCVERRELVEKFQMVCRSGQ